MKKITTHFRKWLSISIFGFLPCLGISQMAYPAVNFMVDDKLSYERIKETEDLIPLSSISIREHRSNMNSPQIYEAKEFEKATKIINKVMPIDDKDTTLIFRYAVNEYNDIVDSQPFKKIIYKRINDSVRYQSVESWNEKAGNWRLSYEIEDLTTPLYIKSVKRGFNFTKPVNWQTLDSTEIWYANEAKGANDFVKIEQFIFNEQTKTLQGSSYQEQEFGNQGRTIYRIYNWYAPEARWILGFRSISTYANGDSITKTTYKINENSMPDTTLYPYAITYQVTKKPDSIPYDINNSKSRFIFLYNPETKKMEPEEKLVWRDTIFVYIYPKGEESLDQMWIDTKTDSEKLQRTIKFIEGQPIEISKVYSYFDSQGKVIKQMQYAATLDEPVPSRILGAFFTYDIFGNTIHAEQWKYQRSGDSVGVVQEFHIFNEDQVFITRQINEWRGTDWVKYAKVNRVYKNGYLHSSLTSIYNEELLDFVPTEIAYYSSFGDDPCQILKVSVSENQKELEGVRVSIHNKYNTYSLTTETEGIAAFENIIGGYYTITAKKIGYDDYIQHEYYIEGTKHLSVQLQKSICSQIPDFNAIYSLEKNVPVIKLTWTAPEGNIQKYILYRDDKTLSEKTSSEIMYKDVSIELNKTYNYGIAAEYEGGCISNPVQVVVFSGTTQTDTETDENPVSIFIYPNPVSKNQMLHIRGIKSDYSIYDMQGRLCHKGNASAYIHISTASFPKGFYFLRSENKVCKFIVN